MKICVVARTDPFNRKYFSGTSSSILASLKKRHKVDWVGEVALPKWEQYFLKLVKLFNKLRGHRTLSNTSVVSKRLGKEIGKRLKNADYDLIFAPAASNCVAYLDTDIPLIYMSDATFKALIDYYPNFTGLAPSYIKERHVIEANTIKRASAIIYSSSWAAESAVNFYNGDKAKISVIEYGPNLLKIPGRDETIRALQNTGICNLLFIGVDWIRKGGDKAYNVFLRLRKDGFSCKLTIIGCNPQLTEEVENICIIPYLDKNKESDLEILYDHLLHAHFFLMPTVADCTPIVFSEAAAFGLPVLTTNTGGIPSVIREGVNGFMFPLDAEVTQYTEKLKAIFSDLHVYTELRKQCRTEYEKRLNWDTWTAKFEEMANSLSVKNKRKSKKIVS